MHALSKLIPAAVIALMVFVPVRAAEDEKAPRKNQPKESAAMPAQKPAAKTERRQAVGTPIGEVLAKDFTLGARSRKVFDAAVDYAGAERLAVAVEAPVGNSIGSDKFRILVWWSLPGADWYVLQDAIAGADFYFDNQGGAVVPVYGSQLRIELRNDGDADLSFHQLTVYAVAH